jgi:hypothetical protein
MSDRLSRMLGRGTGLILLEPIARRRGGMEKQVPKNKLAAPDRKRRDVS